ncbi:MAG: EAL domain-containing protein [Sulfurisoma sp.]|nr:EAL domain-containing protein [Sulfurisoma sp.]
MIRYFRKSIVFGTTVGVVGVALLVGLLFKLVAANFTAEQAEQDVVTHLNELVNTIESTASVACFAKDAQLAKEVVNGVIKNVAIARVVIISDGQELARAERPSQVAGIRTALQPVQRKLVSPFDPNQTIGEIRIEPNHENVDQGIAEQIRFVSVLLAVQLAVIAVAVMGIMYRMVVRPIKAMSDGLHRMDATTGQQLPIPARHAHNELGRLAGDINALAGRLVAALFEEHALRLEREMDERKYRGIFDNADSGIFVADGRGCLQSWNRSFARLSGMPDTAAAPCLADMPWQAPEQLAALIEACLAANAGQAADLELLPAGQRTSTWLHIALSPIGVDTVQGIVSDVTDRKQAEDSAREMAVTDPLTGLGNRLGLEQRLLARMRSSDAFSLMLIDLDGFKQINDAMGFPVGDKVLAMAASRLASGIKSSDWLARTGGDEFAIVLPGLASQETAASIGGRLLGTLAHPFDIADMPTILGASIGIGFFPGDGHDLPTLLRNVELALDRARAGGGNCFEFFDSAMVKAATQRRQLEADMRQGIQRDEFRLFFQPIVDLASHRTLGAEALIRWQHPEHGLVPPDSFIPLAEETGFIRELGLWVVDEACRQLASWHGAGHALYLSVNVSTRQIPDALSLAILLAATTRHGIPPGALALEITEGALMGDMAKALAWLQDVRAAGFRTYLDDFGTGYSSLSYLKRFPMDTVKIDKSFVREMGEDGSDRALVEAIIAMARSLGLKVVAEGVETAAQLALLRGMGCGMGQGYHFSKPVPAADFLSVRDRIDATGW